MRYYGSVYRPPSEAYSLIVQVTYGCSHNTCAFCSMYKEKRFALRPLQEILEDFHMARKMYRHVDKVFLADGDALVRKAEELYVILDTVRELFPECQRVTSYASPSSIQIRTEEELRRMGEICNEYGVMVVADEIHHDLIQPGYKHIVYASLGKEFADNCVICTSLSKTFNLAGLCYASIIIPNDEVRAKFQKQMGLQAFMHIERFGPVAHEAAYRHGAEWLEELIQVIKGNYEYVRDFFAQHFPGVVVTELEGTYLVWCDFRCFGMSDADMKVFLTDECMLYLDNGTDFGAAGSGYQRINVACPRKTLADALDRFYQAAKKRGMAR